MYKPSVALVPFNITWFGIVESSVNSVPLNFFVVAPFEWYTIVKFSLYISSYLTTVIPYPMFLFDEYPQ